jgi:tRNA (mo5U34)-methyltransferase
MIEVRRLVQLHEESRRVAGWIDLPRAGMRDDGHALTISGWVVGTDSRSLAVEVLHAGAVVRSVAVSIPRSDVAALPALAGLDGATHSGFTVGVGLVGLPREFRLDVRVVLGDGRREPLASVFGARLPLDAPAAGGLRPIVVTCLGRSGTTLLMSLLGAHPAVVADLARPYETRNLTYWMHMLKVVGEPGAVTAPDVWFERFAQLDLARPSPFGWSGYPEPDAGADWLRGPYVDNVAAFCRASLDGFYGALAHAQGKPRATCFAEKQSPGPLADVVDEVYPERVELMSIRDPRDMLISVIAYLGLGERSVLGHRASDGEQSVARGLIAELRQLVERRGRLGDRVHVVRYEDLVRSTPRTLAAAFAYAGLTTSDDVVAEIAAARLAERPMWSEQSTAASPDATLERWRDDDRLRRHWDGELEEIIAELGYPPTPGARGPSPTAPGSPRAGALAPALAQELRSDRPWLYEWQLGDGIRTQTPDPEMMRLHRTRLEMIEEPVRAALRAAGPGATAIDLACSEGWFAHRLLEWGAARVVGVDLRPETIRRAQLLRDHFGIGPAQLELRCADLFELDPAQLGRFDVVLMLGLIYHVEDPVGAVRLARALTGSVCALESKLSRHEGPVVHAVGASGATLEAHGSFVTRVEGDSLINPMASAPGVLSMVPNRVAFAELAEVAGFGRAEFADARPDHSLLYRTGDRAVLVAWPD